MTPTKVPKWLLIQSFKNVRHFVRLRSTPLTDDLEWHLEQIQDREGCSIESYDFFEEGNCHDRELKLG